MNKPALLVGLLSAAALASVIACSSTTTTTGSDADAGSGTPADGGSSGSPKDSSTPTVDSSTPTNPDTACGAAATGQDCAQCCATNHTTGYKLFIGTLASCACVGTGADGGAPCATECAATFCKNPPVTPAAACQTCLQDSVGATGACNDTVGTTCQGSADCVAEQKCISLCQGKP
jgi:hypothetical protein